MQITIELDDAKIDEFIRDVMQNQPEHSRGCCLACVEWRYDDCVYVFTDDETGLSHRVDLPTLRTGFAKMLESLYRGELRGSIIAGYLAADVLDSGAWDADCIDALVQYSVLGALVYG